jgi:sulfur carrier protein ThiS
MEEDVRMRVTVRFYGVIGDIAKRKDQEIEIADGATVADLLASLSTGNAGFAGIAKQVRAVANGQNVSRDAVLQPGAEVVLMRAIGGGER